MSAAADHRWPVAVSRQVRNLLSGQEVVAA
jgi:hypothetical protein